MYVCECAVIHVKIFSIITQLQTDVKGVGREFLSIIAKIQTGVKECGKEGCECYYLDVYSGERVWEGRSEQNYVDA